MHRIGMSVVVQRKTSGVKRTGPSEYRAITDDAHFVYRFWLKCPRHVVVFLQSLDEESLDPKIYVDRGNGFDENDAVSVRQGRACIYSIAISPPRKLTRIRIDPSSCEGRFRYWARFAWREADVARLLIEAKRNGEANVPVENVVVNGTPQRRARRKTAKSCADHFASVIKLAEHAAPPIDPSMMRNAPFISFVVPVFNTLQVYLNDLLDSFHRQPAGAAELILCDDGSTSRATRSWLSRHKNARDVRIIRNEKNRGIAAVTDPGIAAARGEWIGFVDHDDALTPCVVQLIAQAAYDNPNCKFIYTDEVVTDKKLKPLGYFLKPAYDEVLLSSVNYINHLSCYRRDRLLALGGLRAGYDGSQDYDLLLRYVRGLSADEIKHLPYPGYRWRRTGYTFSAQFKEGATTNARRALAERYRRGDVEPVVDAAIAKELHRVRFDQMENKWPRVSVVIPNRDSYALISRVISDLTVRTDYPDLEIIVVDNGTSDPRVIDLYGKSAQGAIAFKYEIEPAPFNFSRQVNRGVALATGELILLLNNDIEVMGGDWLREMVSCFDYPDTGIVGARLLYPNRRLQHAGVIVGLGGLAGHWFNGQRENFPGPMARLHVRQSLTAVTGACMLISRACLAKVGPFDEREFAVAYNDVDFCLRAVAGGFRVVWTPFATLIHHESASRGSDETPANRDRFERDKASLRRRHQTGSFEDRAFSPWYSRDRSEPLTVLLDQLPKAR
jgi:GT2 family glycosyltransferase